METELTPKQKNRLRVALLETDKVRTLVTPLERHQFVLKYNWDEGLLPLVWIAKQPDTDKGTIHLIYWMNGPRFLHQYTDTTVPDIAKGGYNLCTLLEQNVENNIYTSAQIHFDPKTSGLTDFTKEYSDIQVVKPIPQDMFQVVSGVEIKEQVLEERIERLVYPTDEQMNAIQATVKKGFSTLKKFNIEIAEDASSSEVIGALQRVIDSFATAEPKKVPDKKQKVVLKSLDFLWAAQVVQNKGWHWVMMEAGYPDDLEVKPALISPEKAFWWPSGHNYPMWGFSTPHPKFPTPTLAEHIEQLATVDSLKAAYDNPHQPGVLPKGIFKIPTYLQKP